MRLSTVCSSTATLLFALAGAAFACSNSAGSDDAGPAGGHAGGGTGGAAAGSSGSAGTANENTAGAGGDVHAIAGGGAGGSAEEAGQAGMPAGGRVERPPCRIQAPTSCPDPAPVYADVEPIFAQRCVGCHDGTQTFWPLTTYGHVATWRDTIRAALLTCSMPPADSAMWIPDDESLRILVWIRCGMPL